MRKETSTNAANEQFLFGICELNSAVSIISGAGNHRLFIQYRKETTGFIF
ncbi:hypothetical protein J2799_003293 [Chryseobacterium vietnamense]|nr:hypothetical protein [Chryseobacterium vietnamense]MDR6488758.1 hypothetical protein [Chryseobacterium vietnamense]